MLAYSTALSQCAFFSLSPDRHLGYPPAPALGTRHPPFYWLKFKNPEAQSGRLLYCFAANSSPRAPVRSPRAGARCTAESAPRAPARAAQPNE